MSISKNIKNEKRFNISVPKPTIDIKNSTVIILGICFKR